MLLFASIEGADCHSVEKNAPAAPSDEEAFSLLMAQISLLVVAAAFLLCMSWREKDDRYSKSRRKSRPRSKKSSDSSRSRKAETKGRVFKDKDESLTERGKHLDQLFAETLDQDIARCKPSKQPSKKYELTEAGAKV